MPPSHRNETQLPVSRDSSISTPCFIILLHCAHLVCPDQDSRTRTLPWGNVWIPPPPSLTGLSSVPSADGDLARDGHPLMLTPFLQASPPPTVGGLRRGPLTGSSCLCLGGAGPYSGHLMTGASQSTCQLGRHKLEGQPDCI